MKVLVGLGNPGEKYKHTRHNIGFAVVDEIAKKYSQTTWVKKFNGKFCQCWSEGNKFLLLKPETFMNNSGHSVAAIIAFYKLNINDLIVIHDDLDLEVGQIKIKHKGGHAGHNGIKSIHHAIGEKYTRVKIGIGHPGNKNEVSSYVLSNFTKSDNIALDAITKSCTAAVNNLILENFLAFLQSQTTLTTKFSQESEVGSKTIKNQKLNSQILENPLSDDTSFSVLKRIVKKLT
jgi:PTH1 family peptidyl-tRNA hydrolase